MKEKKPEEEKTKMKDEKQPKKLAEEKKKEKKAPMSKSERRLHSTELAMAGKKKRKRYYTLEDELTPLWKKMRCRNIAKEERSKFVTEALQKIDIDQVSLKESWLVNVI